MALILKIGYNEYRLPTGTTPTNAFSAMQVMSGMQKLDNRYDAESKSHQIVMSEQCKVGLEYVPDAEIVTQEQFENSTKTNQTKTENQ
jgi:hypothetical protein